MAEQIGKPVIEVVELSKHMTDGRLASTQGFVTFIFTNEVVKTASLVLYIIKIH